MPILLENQDLELQVTVLKFINSMFSNFGNVELEQDFLNTINRIGVNRYLRVMFFRFSVFFRFFHRLCRK